MSKLYFTVSAPLQSYGKITYSAHRMTYQRPTKTAIIGLIGAGLGYAHEDKRLDELANQLDITNEVIKPGSLLVDYQNCHYNTGIKKPNIKNKQLWRYYLQDAKFKIIITGEPNLLKKIQCSLKHPAFQLYLGRRSCPLDRPLNLKYEE